MSITNMFQTQSIVSGPAPGTDYSIFGFQEPLNLGLFLLFVSLALSLVYRNALSEKVLDEGKESSIGQVLNYIQGDRWTLFVLLLVAFASVDLLATAATQEFGRPFERLVLYEVLVIVAVQAYAYRALKNKPMLIRLLIYVVPYLAVVFSLLSYFPVFNAFGQSWPLLRAQAVPSYASIIGWLLFASTAVAAFLFPISLLTMLGSKSIPNVLYRFRPQRFARQYSSEEEDSIRKELAVGNKIALHHQMESNLHAQENTAASNRSMTESSGEITKKASNTDGQEEDISSQLIYALRDYGASRGMPASATLKDMISNLAKEGHLNENSALQISAELESLLYGQRTGRVLNLQLLKECALALDIALKDPHGMPD